MKKGRATLNLWCGGTIKSLEAIDKAKHKHNMSEGEEKREKGRR